jgi:hypothetical protein
VRAVRAYQRQRRYFSFSYDLSKEPFGLVQVRQFPVFRYKPAPSLAAAGRGLWVLAAWGLRLAALGY